VHGVPIESARPAGIFSRLLGFRAIAPENRIQARVPRRRAHGAHSGADLHEQLSGLRSVLREVHALGREESASHERAYTTALRAAASRK
jgi:hypothetical protein